MERNITCSPRRIASHWLLTPRGWLRGAIVSLNGAGVVTDISVPERLDAEAGVEFFSGALVPGLINAHCHLELSALRGAICRGTGLAGFAQAMGGVERDTSDRGAAIGAADAAMWFEGVGAVGDICNGVSSFEVKARSSVRYFNFLELFGLGSRSAAALEPVASAASALGLSFGVTPHSCYSLGVEGFASAVAATSPQPLSVHFMESADEAELFRGVGALGEWYERRGWAADFGGYGSPARRIVAQVPGERRILLIHNTFITEKDVDLLTAHFGDNVTFVLCPRSNLYISGAMPPVDMLRRKGVRIALGTDSLASNDSLSMLEEMKALGGVPLSELLTWATAGGAQALGMDDLGAIEVGRAPGLALLTGADPAADILGPDATLKRIL